MKPGSGVSRASRSSVVCTLARTALLILPQASFAHEFWIEPSTFRAQASEDVHFFLKVGEFFQGEVVPRLPGVMKTFDVATTVGSTAIPGESLQDPAGSLVWAEPRAAIVSYTSFPHPMTLDAVAFERYLAAEGLDHVITWRRDHGASSDEGRERFSRCAKTLMGGEGSRALFVKPLGLVLEIVSELDPSSLSPGDSLPIRVLYDGAPLEGVRVNSWGRDGVVAAGNGSKAIDPATSRTTADGRASVVLSAPGLWLVSAVHMVEAPSGSGADWESYWASLVFKVDTENDQATYRIH